MKFEASKAWKFNFWSVSSGDVPKDAVKLLALSNLKGAFVILVGCHCAALLCLFVEMLTPVLVRSANRRSHGETKRRQLFIPWRPIIYHFQCCPLLVSPDLQSY